MFKKNDPTLASLGEWGFLNRLLPKLIRRSPAQFQVPPGDDAAVLSHRPHPVLTIDGFTEGTHFHSSWQTRVENITGEKWGRLLARKVFGSAISDLAAMGDSRHRWSMIYLGAPGTTTRRFLEDFYSGIDQSARKWNCTLAGGDTVHSKSLTMVAAMGGVLGSRPLRRDGGKPGATLYLAGTVGDSYAGLQALTSKKRMDKLDARYFVKQFFNVEPNLNLSAVLSRNKRVGGAIDVSDALTDAISIYCRDSKVGAAIELSQLPVSRHFKKYFSFQEAAVGGEDFSLLFSASGPEWPFLRLGAVPIGHLTTRDEGISYRMNGKKVVMPHAFQHFQ